METLSFGYEACRSNPGYDYEGAGKQWPSENAGVRGRVVVVGSLIAP